MNREIKFRALVDGVWIYSDDWTKNNGGKLINAKLEGSWIASFAEKCWFLNSRSEFTGLKDKNGTDIYELDVLNGFADGNLKKVIFKNGCFYTQSNENDSNYRLGGWNTEAIEIVGNTIQNPELCES